MNIKKLGRIVVSGLMVGMLIGWLGWSVKAAQIDRIKVVAPQVQDMTSSDKLAATTEGFEIPILSYPSLSSFIATVKARLPRARSQGFIQPSLDEGVDFSDAVLALLQGNTTKAGQLAIAFNYDLVQLQERSTNRSYLVLVEQSNHARGLGTYIIAPTYQRNLILEVPHPLFDTNTLEEGQEIFQQTAARGLFISGTHRCANQELSSCSGKTTACSDTLEPYHVSDVAHYTNNFFQPAHQATLSLPAPPITISLHGNSNSSLPDVVLGNGTIVNADTTSRVNQLRDVLRNSGVSTASCNFARDSKPSLCGETNVQGRLSNSSTAVCQTAATKASNLFLHIEQHLNIRNHPAPLVEALKQVILVE